MHEHESHMVDQRRSMGMKPNGQWNANASAWEAKWMKCTGLKPSSWSNAKHRHKTRWSIDSNAMAKSQMVDQVQCTGMNCQMVDQMKMKLQRVNGQSSHGQGKVTMLCTMPKADQLQKGNFYCRGQGSKAWGKHWSWPPNHWQKPRADEELMVQSNGQKAKKTFTLEKCCITCQWQRLWLCMVRCLH